ncbi:MAG: T9SS type A sorting domain-containing protein [Bacteroidetes bacterium]|nr:T9SS type A sorting domain-containing protein [Bacteroidota bacterium]
MVYSQPCLPEGITFTTQELIDSFQTNYPNCTEIEGDVFIYGSENITNLYGLNILTSIGGKFFVVGNQSLIDFSGLENLIEIGGFFHIGDYDGAFGFYNESLTSLSGLEGLTSIGGDFWIMWNEALTNLSGLSGLSSVGENLIVNANESLVSLTGLEGLNSIGGDLKISSNSSLNTLWGLENLDLSTINSLSIYYNNSLSTCEIPNLCSYLDTLNVPLAIYGNNTGCNNPSEIAETCGIEFSCLPFGDYYFVSQADIDSFSSDYPDCTQLQGSTFIRGINISNLYGLNIVTRIGDGGLHIQNNELLTDLTGLDNLETISGNLIIGGEYPSNCNNSLFTLSGLSLLDTVGGGLYIGYNINLSTFSGLEGLKSIGGYLNIVRNINLTDISALSQLSNIEGDMVIGGWVPYQGNFILQSLSGLENIAPNSIENLVIGHNPVLSECEVVSICEYLAAPIGDVSIFFNTTGCNSPEQVEDACESVDIFKVAYNNKISFFPNPATDKLIVSTNQEMKIKSLSIYNQLGQEVVHKNKACEKIDVSTLDQGIYIVELELIELKVRKKLIIK